MKNSSKSINFNTTNIRLPRQVPPNSNSGDGDDSSPVSLNYALSLLVIDCSRRVPVYIFSYF